VAWGGPTPPYLQAVNDPFCLLNSPPFWRFTIDRSALLSALNLDPTTQIGTHLDSLQTTKKDQAGRVVNVVIRGQKSVATVRGEKLRQVLTRRFGPKSIRSAKFSVERRGDQFVFEGQGWGHGIGLCQRGASARANAGHTTAAIFHHYYPGTSLTQYY
jgi:stage II sporulation protein D